MRTPYPNELYHHGIFGQKWGVRRYQNADGTLTSEGQKRYASSDRDTEVTRGVKKDLVSMNGKDFKKKYGISNSTYMKRVDKYGDPFEAAASPYLKIAEKGINKEAAKAEKKNAKLQKDIDSFKRHENGIYTKSGKQLLSSEDVKKSVESLVSQQKKNYSKVDKMIQQISPTTKVVYDDMTGQYVLSLKR